MSKFIWLVDPRAELDLSLAHARAWEYQLGEAQLGLPSLLTFIDRIIASMGYRLSYHKQLTQS